VLDMLSRPFKTLAYSSGDVTAIGYHEGGGAHERGRPSLVGDVDQLRQ
jgi:hypothetical protein